MVESMETLTTFEAKHEIFELVAAVLNINRFRKEWYRWTSNEPNNGKIRVMERF